MDRVCFQRAASGYRAVTGECVVHGGKYAIRDLGITDNPFN